MIDKIQPARTLERKKREADALKANMKKRKEQAKLRLPSDQSDTHSTGKNHENSE
jgi:hypothetical protein